MTLHRLEDLACQLAKLDERELVFVLSRALPKISLAGREPLAKAEFFLGIVDRSDEGTALEVVAYPGRESYGPENLGPDWGHCQRAASEISGVDYVSNEKTCLSPLSGRFVHLT